MRIERVKDLCLLVSESEEESLLFDKIFGKEVGDDGLISKGAFQCRLSDGLYEHYVSFKVEDQ